MATATPGTQPATPKGVSVGLAGKLDTNPDGSASIRLQFYLDHGSPKGDAYMNWKDGSNFSAEFGSGAFPKDTKGNVISFVGYCVWGLYQTSDGEIQFANGRFALTLAGLLTYRITDAFTGAVLREGNNPTITDRYLSFT
jgi:hypothetical protein